MQKKILSGGSVTILPPCIIAILLPFATLFFCRKTWSKALILMIGTILCKGGRTVCAALRVMGLKGESAFDRYHKVLNRATWSSLEGSKILLQQVLSEHAGPVVLAIDEHIERRSGPKIKAKGCYRDPVRSSKKHMVKCFGLKWITMMVLKKFSWSPRMFALPIMTTLAPSELADRKAGRTHKTTIDWAIQMIKQVRRWLPTTQIILTGDGGFCNASLAWSCIKEGVCLITRLRLDARLFDFPAPAVGAGRKAKKGTRLLKPKQMFNVGNLSWGATEVDWYTGKRRIMLLATFTCLWHVMGYEPIPVRVVLVKDPQGEFDPVVLMGTDVNQSAAVIVEAYVGRWNQEVTHREAREHLGVETQRQWSDKAIARTTPVLFGLYTLILLMADQLNLIKPLQAEATAWYPKAHITFSDALKAVRRCLWENEYLKRFASEDDLAKLLTPEQFGSILDQLADVV
jgi:hypothetical protein